MPRPAALLPLLLLALGGCGAGGTDQAVSSPTLEAIRSRGQLNCGVNGKLPGFSQVEPDGRYSGLDVEICRAVAAAVLGDPTKLEIRELSAAERFAALSSGEVDLISRNTTFSLGRDATGGNGLSFAPVVFYDGQGVMVPTASAVRELRQLSGQSICVLSGSTTELNLADRMRELDLPYTPIKFQTADQTFGAYLSGRCAAVTTDRSGLAAKRSGFPRPDEHRVLPEVFSKEPLAPASRQADPSWADALRWSINALIQAEELGITQANIEAKLKQAKAEPQQAELRRFLGVEGDLGRQLGLPADFAAQAIRAVGNYGEIYGRSVGAGSPLKIERGLNGLWTQGGLMVSPPFR